AAVSGVGDANGDGFADFVAGAPASDAGGVDSGLLLFWKGGSGGPSYDWSYVTGQAGARFGESVGAAGDVNGDGYADVLAGSPLWDETVTDEGRTWLFHGGPGGLAFNPAWTADGGQAGAQLGISAISAGDVNGDGYGDIIAGAWGWDATQPDAGAARVYHGSAAGPSAFAEWGVSPGQAFAEFGRIVSSAGDVNADGYSDVIVGAYLYDGGQIDEGAAFIYMGGENGLSTSPGYVIESNQGNARLGNSVSAAGDVNGDGFGDVVTGAYLWDNPENAEGAVFVHLGGFGGMSGVFFRLETNQTLAELGWSVAGAGDINGDGFADVVAGAPWWDDPSFTDRGAAFVSLGSAAGPGPLVRIGASAGDVGTRFGNSVASAGDVNRDGRSDIVVGCEYWFNFSGG
ncbi:MAG: VCBS repeat-containing protein, partial [Chloroflexi bacterium]|nr:VCBS repeat-containing protein [Chloroflexota bacterium]